MNRLYQILFLLTSTLTHAGTNEQYKTKFICSGAHCAKETKVETVNDRVEIKMEEIKPNQCLVDLETNQAYYVLETDQRSKKVVTVRENSDQVLHRKVEFYDDSAFNRQRRIVPCTQTDTIQISDSTKLMKCLATSSRYAQRYYCEKERLKNLR